MFRRSILASIIGLLTSPFAARLDRAAQALAHVKTAARKSPRYHYRGAYGTRHRSPYAEQKQGSSKKRCHHKGKKARAQRRRSRVRA